jgi:hypothetical protein
MTNAENATQTSIESPSSDSANKTASARLSAHELTQLEEIAKRHKTTPSALIRELILEKIQKETGPQKADILLTEIVGLRLTLVNLLGPLACNEEPPTRKRVEAILEEIKRIKPQVALDILNGETRK